MNESEYFFEPKKCLQPHNKEKPKTKPKHIIIKTKSFLGYSLRSESNILIKILTNNKILKRNYKF